MSVHAKLTERSFTWNWTPLFGAEGQFEGVLNLCIETTSRVLAERRLSTLHDLVTRTSLARTFDAFLRLAAQSLSQNRASSRRQANLIDAAYDLPWLMIYTCTTSTKTAEGGRVKLAPYLKLDLHSSIGVPASHPSAPDSVSVPMPRRNSQSSASSQTATDTIATADGSLPWPFAEAITTRRHVLVPDAIARSLGMTERGWPEATRSAVVVPIGAEDADTPLAVLVLALNPRLPWSEAYATFVRLLGRQLSTGAQTSLSYEQAHSKAEEALALDRAKTHFVRRAAGDVTDRRQLSSASHELRTPLTLILGPINDLLDGTTLTSAARETLTICRRNADRLLGLVNDLLEFSRIDSSRLETTMRPTALGALTADLASLFRSAIERRGVEYIVECDEDSKLVYIDPALFDKVVSNLIGNAAKCVGPLAPSR